MSLVGEDTADCRDLGRFLPRNPLRAGLVPDPDRLDQYPWGGHAGVLGRQCPPGPDRASVLAWFGRTERVALQAYRRRCREARVGLAELQQGTGAAWRRWGRPGHLRPGAMISTEGK
jgi:hypothetical protein